jgi:hypothetical protein
MNTGGGGGSIFILVYVDWYNSIQGKYHSAVDCDKLKMYTVSPSATTSIMIHNNES